VNFGLGGVPVLIPVWHQTVVGSSTILIYPVAGSNSTTLRNCGHSSTADVNPTAFCPRKARSNRDSRSWSPEGCDTLRQRNISPEAGGGWSVQGAKWSAACAGALNRGTSGRHGDKSEYVFVFMSSRSPGEFNIFQKIKKKTKNMAPWGDENPLVVALGRCQPLWLRQQAGPQQFVFIP